MLMLSDSELNEIKKITMVQKRIKLSNILTCLLLVAVWLAMIFRVIPLSVSDSLIMGVVPVLILTQISMLRYDYSPRLLEIIQKCRMYELPKEAINWLKTGQHK